ncbi:MFS transporter [Bacillus sonorensis]|uniref:Major facilitator superfamily protein YycB n=2 Tax=Bacillus sonorensis TaxID=119858 RepID=M5P380_9BACI|nr:MULTISPECIES: MFS transporter [Bacillus]TWK83668.1 putative transporter YycB [Bacillus paralicheniformis]ASB91526.1 putative transporter YycB [Bacillus sonorensis]EME73889.1 major facilitator superfamily protein YycB [Bacillus sonorensis L12]MBG9914821.1 transporter [Bacillus sonorensis]MCF7615872.1 MFS transporter [Bacillus sonorensis]
MHHIDARRNRINNILLITGIIFIAFNLRPSITSVGPLISSIRTDLDMTNGMAGFLTTLPLLSFAFLSPVAPKLGQRLGNERTLWIGLVVLLIGILLRSYGEAFTLFAGTALIGIGIAICNVLLPSLIKHKYPEKAGIMTSFYTTSMSIFAALASGISIPLSHGLQWGWSASLMVWAGLAFLAILIWVPQLRYHDTANRTVSLKTDGQTVWRSKIAWQVTFFMGIQSFLFYCTIAWLPEILKSHGMSMSLSGWMLSLMQFASLPSTFLTPVLAGRFRDQKSIVLGLGILYLAGMTGLLYGGNAALLTLWVVLIGVGQGSSISLALTLIGLRSENAHQAAALSGMSQSAGYLLAAIGPSFVGFLYDHTHSWNGPILLFIAALIALIGTGLGAGRNLYIYAKAA